MCPWTVGIGRRQKQVRDWFPVSTLQFLEKSVNVAGVMSVLIHCVALMVSLTGFIFIEMISAIRVVNHVNHLLNIFLARL